MGKRRVKEELDVNPVKGRDLFVKVVGYVESPVTGGPVQKKWYFSCDERTARRKAARIRALWDELVELGYGTWSTWEDFVRFAILDEQPLGIPENYSDAEAWSYDLMKRYARTYSRFNEATGRPIFDPPEGVDPAALAQARDGAVTLLRALGVGVDGLPLPANGSERSGEAEGGSNAQSATGATFHQGIDAYIQTLAHRPVKERTRQQMVERARRLKAHHADLPLASLGYDAIMRLGDYWRGLPPSQTAASKGKKPISPDTASNQVKTLKEMLEWLSATDTPPFTAWKLPGQADKLFRVSRKRLRLHYADRTGESLDRRDVRVFTDGELAALWKHAAPLVRLYMMVALNTGATQAEIASMRIGEFLELGTPRARCERDRSKTGIFGRYRLFGFVAREVGKLVQQRTRAGAKPTDHLFLTKGGLPIVRPEASNDAISRGWQKVLQRCKAEGEPIPLPSGFKYLRKTGGNFLRQNYDSETAALYLSHAATSEDPVLEVYANKPFDKLDQAMPAWEAYLKRALGASPPSTSRTSATQKPRPDHIHSVREAAAAGAE